MSGARNLWLLTGGLLSLAVALLHMAIVIGGPRWYLFFGAGEQMAAADAAGSWVPAAITLGIAAILTGWAAYAWSGAGLVRRLPLLVPALIAITAVYLTRGILFPVMASLTTGISMFNFWSSSIVFTIGAVHAIGLWQAWPQLSKRKI